MKAPEHFWNRWHPLALLLWPISLLFGLGVRARRFAYQVGWLSVQTVGVPVVIIGNISVGGTGKTPLVIWAARHLMERGYRPGVILRGYGGDSDRWPREVDQDSDPAEVGDEAVVIARRCNCPVVAGPDRVAAARHLVAISDCDLLLSDDGLQHYALARDAEISVMDQRRKLGNGMLLPAGPLREGRGRLNEVDLVALNGDCDDLETCFQVVAGDAVNLHDGERRPLASFADSAVHALAGIGDNRRFFNTLRDAGLSFDERSFPDHHAFIPADLDFEDELPVLITEKDAVKCTEFAAHNHWYLPVEARPNPRLEKALISVIARILPDGQKTA